MGTQSFLTNILQNCHFFIERSAKILTPMKALLCFSFRNYGWKACGLDDENEFLAVLVVRWTFVFTGGSIIFINKTKNKSWTVGPSNQPIQVGRACQHDDNHMRAYTSDFRSLLWVYWGIWLGQPIIVVIMIAATNIVISVTICLIHVTHLLTLAPSAGCWLLRKLTNWFRPAIPP